MGIEDKIIPVTQDCSDTQFIGKQILVINTSTNDIPSTKWLSNVPKGSVVAIQGRDCQPNNPDNQAQDLDTFNQRYPLAKTLLLDSIKLQAADGNSYNRFMKMGLR